MDITSLDITSHEILNIEEDVETRESPVVGCDWHSLSSEGCVNASSAIAEGLDRFTTLTYRYHVDFCVHKRDQQIWKWVGKRGGNRVMKTIDVEDGREKFKAWKCGEEDCCKEG